MLALVCLAGATHASVPGVVINSARTVADSVRDGVLTFGRTTRAFFLGGPAAAEDTWYENAEATRDRAQRNAARVREEAGFARVERHRRYDDGGYSDDRDYYDERDRRYDDEYEYRDEPLPPADPRY